MMVSRNDDLSNMRMIFLLKDGETAMFINSVGGMRKNEPFKIELHGGAFDNSKDQSSK